MTLWEYVECAAGNVGIGFLDQNKLINQETTGENEAHALELWALL